jgi:hypothetical protein
LATAAWAFSTGASEALIVSVSACLGGFALAVAAEVALAAAATERPARGLRSAIAGLVANALIATAWVFVALGTWSST